MAKQFISIQYLLAYILYISDNIGIITQVQPEKA